MHTFPVHKQRRERNPSGISVAALNFKDIHLRERHNTVQGCIEYRQIFTERVVLQIGQFLHPTVPVFCIDIGGDYPIDVLQILLKPGPVLEKNPLRVLQKKNKSCAHQGPKWNLYSAVIVNTDAVFFVDIELYRSLSINSSLHTHCCKPPPCLLYQGKEFRRFHSLQHSGIVVSTRLHQEPSIR